MSDFQDQSELRFSSNQFRSATAGLVVLHKLDVNKIGASSTNVTKTRGRGCGIFYLAQAFMPGIREPFTPAPDFGPAGGRRLAAARRQSGKNGRALNEFPGINAWATQKQNNEAQTPDVAEQNQDNLELGGQAAFCASPTRVIQEADHIMDTVNEGARTKTAWA